MTEEDTIIAIEVQETEYGEKVVLQSPFEAKDFIKALPWKEVQEEVSDHGSLKAKAISRGMDADNVAIQAIEDFDFSDDFATHASWESTALGPDSGAWTIDVDALDEAFEFFEFAGFETKNHTQL